MHEQHGSNGGLSLAVALVRPVDGVGLQDPVQVLLPAQTPGGQSLNCTCCYLSVCVSVPVAAASSKHLVEGELAMQVLLDDVQPLCFSLLPLQLLQGERRCW